MCSGRPRPLGLRAYLARRGEKLLKSVRVFHPGHLGYAALWAPNPCYDPAYRGLHLLSPEGGDLSGDSAAGLPLERGREIGKSRHSSSAAGDGYASCSVPGQPM